ncbi:hypothetical protein MASSI9I_20742 [Massilia sp. 9I]|nr:hypothetical protein MASSI9I_20742 [Massilia sp. 9I]
MGTMGRITRLLNSRMLSNCTERHSLASALPALCLAPRFVLSCGHTLSPPPSQCISTVPRTGRPRSSRPISCARMTAWPACCPPRCGWRACRRTARPSCL